MPALIQLLLVGALAGRLQHRVVLLESFKGLPRYFCALGLTVFLVVWGEFLLHAVFDWGVAYQVATWSGLGGALVAAWWTRPARSGSWDEAVTRPERWNYCFWGFAIFLVLVFGLALRVDAEGNVWWNFNFSDTAFHLSVANSFLATPGFPPRDLDLWPYPLKYHFLADFEVAHLARLGLSPLTALRGMNVIGAATLAGSLWAVFERWLRLPRPWVLLACCVFLGLNTALINLIHFGLFEPVYFSPAHPLTGVLLYPYFNFEFALGNYFEQQRALVFAFPVLLVAFDAVAARREAEAGGGRGVAWAVAIACLSPFAHIVGFAMLGAAALPAAWRERRRLTGWLPWGWPLVVLMLAQLAYLAGYGPPVHADFSGWDARDSLPLGEFAGVPMLPARVIFWFFVDGDFLLPGLLLAAVALAARRWLTGATWCELRRYLGEQRWLLAAGLAALVGVNFYRYSFDWGDSNKFVLFLNLALTPVIVFGVAAWRDRGWRVASGFCWTLLMGLSLWAPGFIFYHDAVRKPPGSELLFQHAGVAAAAWLRAETQPEDVVLTSANNIVHFVTSLAGRPTLAGLYGMSNPYRQDERVATIRKIYAEGELWRLRELGVRYVCLSRNERRRYRIHPIWRELSERGEAVAWHEGEPGDYDSVFIFDVRKLPVRP